MVEKTAIMVLAAGNSSRLGSPKQLLNLGGKKLLVHVVEQACKSNSNDVFVVLGSNQEILEPLLSHLEISVVTNEDWERGMGSSIKKGISRVIESYDYSSVIISVCDQPYLSQEIFDQLLNQDNETEIVASAYADGNYGPPTLFRHSLFHKLLEIPDSKGAKALIKGFDGVLGLIPFAKGEVDMDTQKDYQAYLDAIK